MFLQGLKVPGAENKLETFLLRTLSCNEMTAALRVNTLWKYIYSQPSRWLSGKAGELGWGLDDSSELMDLTEKFMIEVAADGSKLFDPQQDPFASLAEKYPVTTHSTPPHPNPSPPHPLKQRRVLGFVPLHTV